MVSNLYLNKPLERMSESANVGLRDIVYALFRRRLAALVVALPIIAVGAFSLTQQVGSYTAFSKVVVGLASVDLPRWNTTNRSIDYDRELSTLFNIAMSVPVAQAAADALSDSLAVITSLDPVFVDLDQPGALFEFLSTHLDVSVVGESSILEFVFTSANPRMSLMAVGALRDAFIEYQVHGRKNYHAVGYYDEQINTVRASVDSLLDLRSKVLIANGYSSVEDDMKFDVGQLAHLTEDLYAATTARRTLEAEYENLSAALKGDPRDFPTGAGDSHSFALISWKNLVGKHMDELNSMLSIHTEESLPIRRQRELIKRDMRSLLTEESAYVESFRIALESVIAKEKSVKLQVKEQATRNSKAPGVYQEVSLLDIELASLRDLMKELQGKRGEVRLDQMADERVSSIVVLNEPELELVFGGGQKAIYFVLIVIIGLVLGAVTAFILDGMDHRIYSPKDVSNKLNLPVLANVSRSD